MDEIPAHCDVDIDYNGIEYEYKIDGATGEILEHEADYGDLPKVKNTAAGLRFSLAAGLYSLFTASHRPPYSVSG